MHRQLWRTIAIALGLIAIGAACPLTSGRGSSGEQGEAPAAKETPGKRPSEILHGRPMHAPPGLAAEADATAFVDWAAGSLPEEREDGRGAIAKAAASPGASAVAKGLVAEIQRAREVDHSRTLVALAVLGEMKNKEVGMPFLVQFASQPLPEKGTLIDGEIIERTSLLQLESKAVQGLAYMRDDVADREVMKIISSHPSRVIRGEAINAWLWNRQDSQAAREQLAQLVKPEDRILIDRPRWTETSTAEQFNRDLAVWLKAHPELAAPAPVKAKPRGEQKKGDAPGFDAAPPVP